MTDKATASATVVNRNGLHARPSGLIVELANQFDSDIAIKLGARSADAKTIIDLMMLTATCGSELTLEASGSDAQEAVTQIADLINSGFGVDE